MAYRGKFKPINESKYEGNLDKITYRSLWERNVMRWLDYNDDVVSWGSETLIIPYRCRTDGRLHRYYTDFTIKFANGKRLVVEVKPHIQSEPPKKPVTPKAKQGARYRRAVMTWAKNVSKWEAAAEYTSDRNWEFAVWTEKTLKTMGIGTGKR